MADSFFDKRPVLIAGGGIGGMALALTLHQIGVPCIVYEAVDDLRPLGVGINLQPNAVRELYDLGFDDKTLGCAGTNRQGAKGASPSRQRRSESCCPRVMRGASRGAARSVDRGTHRPAIGAPGKLAWSSR